MHKTNIEPILKIARESLQIEGDALLGLIPQINEQFALAIQTIQNCKGRVIVTGIGKSANIATKVVATFNSTGTPAMFMHAADAIHGDLGMLQKQDVIICLSKSGETDEIKNILPSIKKRGNVLIAVTGEKNSFLANNADVAILAYVAQEACPNNLAPTSSTIAQLAIGDALAICLLKLKGFSDVDFAQHHPGGSLGKALTLSIGALVNDAIKPTVAADASMKDVILEISSKRLGATAVLSENKLVGVITDGDVRRMLEKNNNLEQLTAADVMTANPKTIKSTTLAKVALAMMSAKGITQIIVTKDDIYLGMVHLHDLIKEGLV